MAGKADLAVDLDRLRLGLHTVKLDAVIGRVKRHSAEPAKEIEMPPGAAKLAIGGELEPDLLLLFNRVFDLAIFDRAQRLGGDFVARALLARRLERGRAQQAADVIGAKWRAGALHFRLLGAAQQEVVRCRPGIVANSEYPCSELVAIPDQRRSVSRCTASGIQIVVG